MATTQTFDPRELLALGRGDLALVARTVVDGTNFGVHPSRITGAGTEFSQYRSYQPGDDIRRVDWKLYGRSDRFFVREAEIETSVTLNLVLDASESMAHTEDGLRKFDVARMIVAALALMADRQGDAIGLTILNDRDSRTLLPRRGHQQLYRVIHELEQAAPRGRWPGDLESLPLVADGSTRGIVVLVTDLHERHREIAGVARRLASLRQDTRVVHLLGQHELAFDYTGTVTFEELETGRRTEVDAESARQGYLTRLERRTRELSRGLEEARVRYDRAVMQAPLDQTLRRIVTSRESD